MKNVKPHHKVQLFTVRISLIHINYATFFTIDRANNYDLDKISSYVILNMMAI